MSPLVFLLLLFAVFGVYGGASDRSTLRRRDEERLDTLEDIARPRGRVRR